MTVVLCFLKFNPRLFTASLIEAVFLEYARFLTNIGLRKAAEYYCHLAGDKGEQFLKEVEILFT